MKEVVRVVIGMSMIISGLKYFVQYVTIFGLPEKRNLMGNILETLYPVFIAGAFLMGIGLIRGLKK